MRGGGFLTGGGVAAIAKEGRKWGRRKSGGFLRGKGHADARDWGDHVTGFRARVALVSGVPYLLKNKFGSPFQGASLTAGKIWFGSPVFE